MRTLFGLLLAAAGCTAQNPDFSTEAAAAGDLTFTFPDDGGSSPADEAHADDAPPALPDLAAPRDAAAPPDLAPPADLRPPADLARPADLMCGGAFAACTIDADCCQGRRCNQLVKGLFECQ